MDNKIDNFLSQYSDEVFTRALKLREVILANLPDVTEQLDIPARMIGYCYGQKYADMICTIIPSKKGLKLGFAWATDFPDPDGLLEGTGKISRYVVIESEKQIKSAAVKKLLVHALKAYKMRVGQK